MGKAVFAAWLLFTGAGCLFGLFLLFLQHHRLTTYRPTSATVRSVHVEVLGKNARTPTTRPTPQVVKYGTSSSRLRPAVLYEYTVAGHTLHATAVFPFSLEWFPDNPYSRKELDQLLQPFRPGQSITVRYDPADPARTFLLPTPSSLPHFFLFVSGLLLLAGVAGFVLSRPLRDRLRTTRLLAAAVLLFGLLLFGHYFYFAGPRPDRSIVELLWFYAHCALLPLPFCVPRRPGLCTRVRLALFFALVGGALVGTAAAILATLGKPRHAPLPLQGPILAELIAVAFLVVIPFLLPRERLPMVRTRRPRLEPLEPSGLPDDSPAAL